MGKNIIIQNYYDKTINGLEGVITNMHHDKDCLYTQGKWAEVRLENGIQKTLRTCFLREI